VSHHVSTSVFVLWGFEETVCLFPSALIIIPFDHHSSNNNRNSNSNGVG
jgi:hypothetical protein